MQSRTRRNATGGQLLPIFHMVPLGLPTSIPPLPHHHERLGQTTFFLCPFLAGLRVVLHMVHRRLRRREWVRDGQCQLQSRERRGRVFRTHYGPYHAGDLGFDSSERGNVLPKMIDIKLCRH